MGWHPSMSSVSSRAESLHAVQYTLTMQYFKLYYSNVICSLCQLPAFYYVNVVLYLIYNPPQNHAFKLNISVRPRSTPGTETHNNMQHAAQQQFQHHGQRHTHNCTADNGVCGSGFQHHGQRHTCNFSVYRGVQGSDFQHHGQRHSTACALQSFRAMDRGTRGRTSQQT